MIETAIHTNSTGAGIEARVALNASRVFRNAVGAILAGPEANSLSPLAVGCLVQIVRQCSNPAGNWASPRLATRHATAILAGKGVSGDDCDLVISALELAGMLSVEGASIFLPVLDKAINDEAASLHNRKAGWAKRGGGRAPSAPVVAGAPVTPAVRPGQSDSLLPAETAPAEPPARIETAQQPKAARANPSHRRLVNGVEFRRLTSSDKLETCEMDDPVVTRLPCRGDSVAEITENYRAHLQEIFRGVDVESELKKCSLWCESNPKLRKTIVGIRRFINHWLTNAQRDHQMRSAVVRTSSQRNGFGQGGAYSDPSYGMGDAHAQGTSYGQEPAKAHAAPQDLDDLRDLWSIQGGSEIGVSQAQKTSVEAAPMARPQFADSQLVLAPVEQERRSLPRVILAARARRDYASDSHRRLSAQ